MYNIYVIRFILIFFLLKDFDIIYESFIVIVKYMCLLLLKEGDFVVSLLLFWL